MDVRARKLGSTPGQSVCVLGILLFFCIFLLSCFMMDGKLTGYKKYEQGVIFVVMVRGSKYRGTQMSPEPILTDFQDQEILPFIYNYPSVGSWYQVGTNQYKCLTRD